MKKRIEIILLPEAERYFERLPFKMQRKFASTFDKTKLGYKGEWFKKLKGTDGIFEFRTRDESGFYRLFAFWDTRQDFETLIIGTHGLQKKTNKTPQTEIKRAERIKRFYFKLN